jgi:Kef-type K+ transport system membrane component KefB
LQAVSQLGLFALLFLTGLESELDELVAVGLQASTVAVAGVVLSLPWRP